MNTKVKQSIIALAETNPTEEICGFIYISLGKAYIKECMNISLNRTNEFEISSSEYLDSLKLGDVIGIYHSHPNYSEAFSEADLDLARELALPIYVYSVLTKGWNSYIPESYTYSLCGQEFCWGFGDCLGCVSDYFRMNKGIFVSDYDRDETFDGSDNSIILDNYIKEGFELIAGNGPIQVDDVLLFRSLTHYPHHMAVFIGNSRMIHHPLGQLSRVDQFTSSWMKRLTAVLRYKGKVGV